MKSLVGLLATSRKKLDRPEKVVDFYQSPLFIKSVNYARLKYDRFYFYNAKDGLLLPDQTMAPYDVSIKTFSAKEKRAWAKEVVLALNLQENPQSIQLRLHGGFVYRKYLEPTLDEFGYQYDVPLKGLGIGKQLLWYDQKIKELGGS